MYQFESLDLFSLYNNFLKLLFVNFETFYENDVKYNNKSTISFNENLLFKISIFIILLLGFGDWKVFLLLKTSKPLEMYVN